MKKLVNFLFQYALFNVLCWLSLSAYLFVTQPNEGIIDVFCNTLFVICFAKLNIAIQLTQFGYLLLFSVCCVVSFVFSSRLVTAIPKSGEKQHLRLALSLLLSVALLLIVIQIFHLEYLFFFSVLYLALFASFSWLFDCIDKKRRYVRFIAAFVMFFVLLSIEVYSLAYAHYT